MITQEQRETLGPFLRPGISWGDIDLSVGRLNAQAPNSLAPTAIASVTQAQAKLRVAGISLPGEIILNRYHARYLNTAAGMALLAHELHHQWQFEHVPNFQELFDLEYERTPEDQPWLNPFEFEAYQLECVVWHELVADGWPGGPWVPVGVELEFC